MPRYSEEQKKIIEKEKEILSVRLRELRTNAGLSQREMGRRLNLLLSQNGVQTTDIRPASYCNWESGRVLPKRQTIKALAELFGVTPGYLTGETSNPQGEIVSGKKIPENSLKLLQYDGQPVFCVSSPVTNEGFFALVDGKNRSLITSTGRRIYFQDINFPVRNYPQPFQYPENSDCQPLSAEDIRDKRHVWVEPIGGEYTMRQNLKGWYEYNKPAESVVNESGVIFPLSLYGKTWVAFEDVIKYEDSKEIVKESR